MISYNFFYLVSSQRTYDVELDTMPETAVSVSFLHFRPFLRKDTGPRLRPSFADTGSVSLPNGENVASARNPRKQTPRETKRRAAAVASLSSSINVRLPARFERTRCRREVMAFSAGREWSKRITTLVSRDLFLEQFNVWTIF